MERGVGGPTILIEGLHLYVIYGFYNTSGNSDKTWSNRSFAHVTNRCRICTTGYVFLTEPDFVRPLSHLCGGYIRADAMADDITGRVYDCPGYKFTSVIAGRSDFWDFSSREDLSIPEHRRESSPYPVQ